MWSGIPGAGDKDQIYSLWYHRPQEYISFSPIALRKWNIITFILQQRHLVLKTYMIGPRSHKWILERTRISVTLANDISIFCGHQLALWDFVFLANCENIHEIYTKEILNTLFEKNYIDFLKNLAFLTLGTSHVESALVMSLTFSIFHSAYDIPPPCSEFW